MARTGKRFEVIGITGSFGTGKSTVAGIFAGFGAKVIDADKLTHQTMEAGKGIYKRIVSLFGPWGILKDDGTIDRRRLGKFVFSDRNALDKLCRLIHPQVNLGIKEEINRIKKENPCGTHAIIILDAPLLIEAGLLKDVDRLIVVKASRKKQFKRCISRNGMTGKDIARRISSQMPLKSKVKLADYVIDNNGSLAETKRQAEKIWLEVKNSGSLKASVTGVEA